MKMRMKQKNTTNKLWFYYFIALNLVALMIS